jgi:ribosomal-protein-alanine N-acetyltransferase
MEILKLERGDVPEVIAISKELGLCAWPASSLVEEIARDNSVMLKLVDEAFRIMGFAAGRVVTTGVDDCIVELFNIGIREPFQGRGLGQQIFDEFIIGCRDVRAGGVILEVRKSNTVAINFYKRNGLQIIAQRPAFYSDPTDDAFTMKLIFNLPSPAETSA